MADRPLDATCDNVTASRLGEAAWDAVRNAPPGTAEYIDFGLRLLRLLREAGFVVFESPREEPS